MTKPNDTERIEPKLTPEQAATREEISTAIDPVEAARLERHRRIALANKKAIEAARAEDASWHIRHVEGRARRRDYGDEI